MFTNPFSSTSSESSGSLSSSSSLSPFPAGCRDYRRSSSIVTLSRNGSVSSIEGTVAKSTFMPRGARDYEKHSPAEVQQSCVMVAAEGESGLRRIPLGSLHYKQAFLPVVSKKRSTSESGNALLGKDF